MKEKMINSWYQRALEISAKTITEEEWKRATDTELEYLITKKQGEAVRGLLVGLEGDFEDGHMICCDVCYAMAVKDAVETYLKELNDI